MMNRRSALIALAFGPLTRGVFAQTSATHRISWLSPARPTSFPASFDAFRQGLTGHGYVEGRNLALDAHRADDSDERLTALTLEILQSRPQVVVTQGPAVFAMLRAQASVPIVFAFSGDPVEAKLVESLARPGRNFTGMSFLSLELVGKRMEVLAEALPGLKRIAILANPEHAGARSELIASRAAANRMSVDVEYYEMRVPADVDNAFQAATTARCQAVVVFPDARTTRYSGRIAELAVRHRVPSISGWAQFAQSGNLLSYGPNLRDAYMRLATFVDRILKGSRPADLPVELPAKVELVVNLKAANALGLSIPQSLLVRADEVIR
jgi:putative ABC transport system substrate-binding protein